ncbi:four helix bundle protein [Salibacteraceae bacterium]|jgi:four helix bundle protein|nr:four helix bundle protein [Salibacteraceae bacterium]
MNDKNPILERSIEFALQAIKMSDKLRKSGQLEIKNQFIRSGTSIGANIHEAQYGSSTADFLHKLKIARKEANEVKYWITLCNRSPHLPNAEYLMEEIESIRKILSSIILNTERNQKKKGKE